jgi:Sigma-54, DNA binding domain
MGMIDDWIDAGVAKRAAIDAYRAKYPERGKPLMLPHEGGADQFLFWSPMHAGDSRSKSWWSVSRPDFKAVEIDEPKNAWKWPPDRWNEFDAFRRALPKIVDAEDKHNPYTDQELAAELAKRGIRVAVHTVTTYRQMMGIPSARRRRVR